MVNEHDDRDETFWAPGTVALEDGRMSFPVILGLLADRLIQFIEPATKSSLFLHLPPTPMIP